MTLVSRTLCRLSCATFELADVAAAAGIPVGRLKNWLQLGTVIAAEEPKPGTGKRRQFPLLDVYQLRLVATLGRHAEIGPAAASEIVNRALFDLYLAPGSGISLQHLREQYRDLEAWPPEYLNRDLSNPSFLMAWRSDFLGTWLRKWLAPSVTLGDLSVFYQRPSLPDGGEERVNLCVIVNVTAELDVVDHVLLARLSSRPARHSSGSERNVS